MPQFPNQILDMLIITFSRPVNMPQGIICDISLPNHHKQFKRNFLLTNLEALQVQDIIDHQQLRHIQHQQQPEINYRVLTLFL
jgi:hypothetical protein